MTKYTHNPYYDSKEWRMLRDFVCNRDRHFCQYCGAKGHQADHVIPRSRGGRDHPENLVCCCQSCNRAAMATSFVDFAHKKSYVLAARGIVIPISSPRPVAKEKPLIHRRPPKRGSLRQKLVEKNRPQHYEEELLQKSRS